MSLICFTSPKGGVGKTTLAANVADGLHRLGHKVLAIDLDPQNALRLHFGVSLMDRTGFMAELASKPDWRSHVRQTDSGVQLIAHGALDLRGALGLVAALDRDADMLSAPMREMLAGTGLVVVADLPPGPSQALAILAPMATMVIGILQAEAISAALVPEIESGRFLGRRELWGPEPPALTRVRGGGRAAPPLPDARRDQPGGDGGGVARLPTAAPGSRAGQPGGFGPEGGRAPHRERAAAADDGAAARDDAAPTHT